MSAPDTTDLSLTREAWLHRFTEAVRPWFEGRGYPLPTNVHLSVGFPVGGGRESKAVPAQVLHSSLSADGVNHVFISPQLGDTSEVARVLLHMLIHVALDCEDGHTGRYSEIAVMFGFDTPMDKGVCSPGLAVDLMTIADTLGPYPHGVVDVAKLRSRRPASQLVEVGTVGTVRLTSGPPKQDNRWVFLTCEKHGGSYRTSRKWLELGAPLCGVAVIGDEGVRACQTVLVPKVGTQNAGKRQRKLPGEGKAQD